MNGAHIFPFVLSSILKIPLTHLLHKTFSYFKGHLSYPSKYPGALIVSSCLFCWYCFSDFYLLLPVLLQQLFLSCLLCFIPLVHLWYELSNSLSKQVSNYFTFLFEILQYILLLSKRKCPVILLYHEKPFLLWSIQNWFHFSLPIHICDILTGVLEVEWTSTRVLDSEVTQRETHRSFWPSSPWGGF